MINTDNISVLDLNIDYGPYGFFDIIPPEVTPNEILDDKPTRFQQAFPPLPSKTAVPFSLFTFVPDITSVFVEQCHHPLAVSSRSLRPLAMSDSTIDCGEEANGVGWSGC